MLGLLALTSTSASASTSATTSTSNFGSGIDSAIIASTSCTMIAVATLARCMKLTTVDIEPTTTLPTPTP